MKKNKAKMIIKKFRASSDAKVFNINVHNSNSVLERAKKDAKRAFGESVKDKLVIL